MDSLFKFDRHITKCPICEKKLKTDDNDDFYMFCINGCITLYCDVSYIVLDVCVFNEKRYTLLLHENHHGYGDDNLKQFNEDERELLKTITELKENDNYLVEILNI